MSGRWFDLESVGQLGVYLLGGGGEGAGEEKKRQRTCYMNAKENPSK